MRLRYPFTGGQEKDLLSSSIEHEENIMRHTDFNSAIVTDFAPSSSLCEWCQQPAVHQLTVIGGIFHNESGYFCSLCGEEFARTVAASLHKSVESVAIAHEQAFK